MLASQKVIVVTGAGGGVGRELVLQLLAKGAGVAAVDINQKALKETCEASGNSKSLSTHVGDITDRMAVAKLAEEVINTRGHVDALINNAGIIQPFVNINDLDLDRIKLVMDVNFFGTLYMVKSFLPHLLKRPEGHITNVSSMGGFLPVPGQVAYGASKAAVRLLTEGLHSELRKSNVHVSLVLPGGIATDIMKNSHVDNNSGLSLEKAGKFLLSPAKAARLIIRAMEKNRFRSFIGKDCRAMNFLYKRFPGLAMGIINKALGSMVK